MKMSINCPPIHPFAPPGNQCEMLHYLASVGLACNLILHIHVVVN